jgi:2-polyprenyl-3-methyl-5-hydroxy-6-metoxy-1,4-benzoquinol methylase
MKKSEKYYAQTRAEMLAFIPVNAKKILEVGCGQGNFSAQLTKEGVETWGIEPNPQSAKDASKKLFKVLSETLDNALAELPDNYFDAIIFNDVIEHLLYPWEDLKRVKSKLSKEGVVVSSIPNVRYSKNLFNLLFKKNWKYTEGGVLDVTHFRFFTKKSIKVLYKDSGYSIQTIKGVNITKSFLFFPFAVLFNILFLCTQLDMFYMQFATVAKKTREK